MVLPPEKLHSKSESLPNLQKPQIEAVEVDTFDGKIHVEWDPTAAVTPIGQLPFFIQFLKLGNRFEPWIDECPLYYKSNNAPTKTDVLGSFLLSVLSGHTRYSHITTLLNDTVNSTLLGMNKVVSDDSARRALKKIDEHNGIQWLQQHLHASYEPLLTTHDSRHPGYSIPMSPLNPSTDINKRRWLATTPTNREDLRILITPI